MECNHKHLIPHRVWDTGSWYWTCSDCYIRVDNQWVTDKMREAENARQRNS